MGQLFQVLTVACKNSLPRTKLTKKPDKISIHYATEYVGYPHDPTDVVQPVSGSLPDALSYQRSVFFLSVIYS